MVARINFQIHGTVISSNTVPWIIQDKIYIYNDSKTYINEVILGAKIENPEDYVSFIYKQGNKMWKDDKQSQIKVTQSTIQYRWYLGLFIVWYVLNCPQKMTDLLGTASRSSGKAGQYVPRGGSLPLCDGTDLRCVPLCATRSRLI